MAVISVDTTANFTISYESTAAPVAQARANAVLATCEADFTRLKHLFNVSEIYGSDAHHPGNRIHVVIVSDSFAHQSGYHDDGTTKVTIDPLATLSTTLGEEGVRMLFVAEVAEILMSYQNKTFTRWNPRGSDGEGLSRVLAATFHPDGYYNTVINGPFVNDWLDSPTRPGWVANTETSDLDQTSYGSAILFLYYLRNQLLIPWSKIIQNAGTTLAQTYTNITGRTDAFTAFSQLLLKHFPAGIPANLKTDNPFPLYDADARSVSIVKKEISNGRPIPLSGGFVEVQPFFTCPKKPYSFSINGQPMRLQCVAEVEGFGEPRFRWHINGQTITSTAGTLNTLATVEVDEPAYPGQTTTTQTNVTLHFQTSDTSSYTGMRGEMDVENVGYPGHIVLAISVDVWEQNTPETITSASTYGTIDTSYVHYSPEFYIDRARCEARFKDTMSHYIREHTLFNLLLTRPDPPSEMTRTIRVLESIRAEIAEVSQVDQAAAREIINALSSQLNIPHKWLTGGQAPEQMEPR